ncbi:MAG: glutamate--tRNA ligase family protein [Myxococcota bacterium]
MHGAFFGATFSRVETKHVLAQPVAPGVDDLPPQRNRSRFAPSTTGPAHPGTLLAALLCWLDARARGAAVLLRLEDLDRERSKPGLVDAMQRDLEWLGLEWDAVERQSEQRVRHEAALERLVEEGRVYACDCSRAQIRAIGALAPDGSHRYPGTCRARRVTRADWRSRPEPLRVRLGGTEPVELRDESGLDLSGDAALAFGDPLLRRRDGAYAYHFVSVVDDAARGVGRVVRGRDLAPSTMLQVALQRLLGYETPTYRHHCLYLERSGNLERSGDKLSKLHGAVGMEALRARYDAQSLCGLVASGVGLVPAGTRCRPAELVARFDWSRVSTRDVELVWDADAGLSVASAPEASADGKGRGGC